MAKKYLSLAVPDFEHKEMRDFKKKFGIPLAHQLLNAWREKKMRGEL